MTQKTQSKKGKEMPTISLNKDRRCFSPRCPNPAFIQDADGWEWCEEHVWREAMKYDFPKLEDKKNYFRKLKII